MGGNLFGTDGIRGRAGSVLGPELALRVGVAFARQLTLTSSRNRPLVVLSGDSRLSTPMLRAAIQSGLCMGGADVVDIGVAPTPLVPFAIKRLRADGGVMVTASHNPVPDNGIKLFNADAFKVATSVEIAISTALGHQDLLRAEPQRGFGTVQQGDYLKSDYLKWLNSLFKVRGPRRALSLLVDCAYGATSELAAPALRQLGHKVTELHARFDGARINVDSGTTGMNRLARQVRRQGCDLGIAFDGDGDRMLAVDERGQVVSGDRLIALFATHLSRYRQRKAVVMTQMTNLGVERALARRGIQLLRTEVGDSKVVARMLAEKVSLGGEQSGHIILLDRLTTGDGILAAAQLAELLAATTEPLSRLVSEFVEFPQQLTNIEISAAAAWLKDRKHQARLARLVKSYPDVRCYLRPSGTEPLVRVLTESESMQRCEEANQEISAVIRGWQT